MKIYMGTIEGEKAFKDIDEVGGMVLVGEPGCGKTTYLKEMLTEASGFYSPEEVRFIIYSTKGIDYRRRFKDGPWTYAYIDDDPESLGVVLDRLEPNKGKTIVVIDDAMRVCFELPSIVEKVDRLSKMGVHFFVVLYFITDSTRPLFERMRTTRHYRFDEPEDPDAPLHRSFVDERGE